jgi:heat-inducible transcriptional repressor
MIPERSLEVLRAIVQDFIHSNQPVGSKNLLDRHPLGVSAATIRNDMALLEEEELITAPHTSSGRIPTEKGYRLFVDRLGEVKALSQVEKSAIEGFLVGSADLDDVVERSARALSQITNALALVQYPSLGRAVVRHVELLPISGQRVLVMLITDSGRIQQVQIESDSAVDENLVLELRGRLNGMLTSVALSQVSAKLSGLKAEFEPSRQPFVSMALEALNNLVDANKQEKLVLSGAANLVKQDANFSGELSLVLEAIEEQVVLLKLLGELQTDQSGAGIRIGSELGLAGLSNTSLVAMGYESGGAEVAKLGVLGPTRMDYSNNIASVRAVAKYLTKQLEERG